MSQDSESTRTSRRDVLRAGAAGAAVAAGAVALPSAAAHAAPGDSDAVAVSFVGRIDQNALDLVGYGFPTSIEGIPATALFGEAFDLTEAATRLTVTGTFTLERRAIRGPVFDLDGSGTLAIRLLDAPGANFEEPATFAAGTVVAEYATRLHSTLTVIAPDTGVPVLSGELVQTAADDFSLDGAWYRIGSVGTTLSMSATGLGTRTDAEAPQAFLEIAAQLTHA
jgi:hypothetical protein